MRQLVKLVNYDDLEGFLLLCIKLLTACDLFDELLNDDSIVIVSFRRGHLQVVDGAEDHTATGRTRGGAYLVLFLLTFNLVDCIRVV